MNANKKNLRKIAKKYKINQIMLFGSQAKKTATPTSDFDIGFLSDKPIAGKVYDRLSRELSQELNVAIQKIDLTNLNHAAPILLGQVAKNSKLLYGKQKDFTNFKLYSIKKYQDHDKFFKLRDKYLKKEYG